MILHQYTDENHRLSQKKIIDILHNEYEMKVDRKSVMRNLIDLGMYLEGIGYELIYDVSVRKVPIKKDGRDEYLIDSATGERVYEEQEKMSDFYLKRTFEDSEIRLLIDAIMFSMNISDKHRRDLATYMKEHIYMYSSANEIVTFKIVKAMISDVMDMFGGDVSFKDETETHVIVTAKINVKSMMQFAKNYAPDVEVLKPELLREEIKEELRKAMAVYV